MGKTSEEEKSKIDEVIPDQKPIYSFEHTMRSRYSETDQMGYVYYGRYLEYFEVARTEMIRSVGYPYSRLEKEGVMLPVVETHIKYKAPLFYDDEIIIRVHLFEKPVVKLETWYEMYTARSQKVHATGQVILCFMKEASRKPCRAPKLFLERLSEAIGD
jgi:acyl-CoA thioester hydrolase